MPVSPLAQSSQDLAPQTQSKHPPLAASGRLEKDGVVIEFEARPSEGTQLMEGKLADVRFKVTDAATGQPVRGLTPGVWLDLAQVIAGKTGGEQKECKDKIALYLKGVVGIRPMLDLNGYYLLVLNQDASITVVDPSVSLGGKTSTFGMAVLRRPPMDWARSADGKHLFVSMPLAGQVAVVETQHFKVVKDIDAGKEPVRVALQPDGRYLWVGNNGRDAKSSGVTVIDTQSLKPVMTLATGRGHHEIAFSDDSRHAFVSNRDEGTVSVFDVASLSRVKDLKTGPRPISLAYSALAGALYVADGSGSISAIDARTLERRQALKAKAGLGPLRLTPDGRFALALNTLDNTATVVDVASNEIVHTLPVSAEPYQISFTRAFAYVRGLATERVTMINLSSLGKGKEPILQGFSAGAEAPKLAGNLPIADSIAPAKADAAVFVVNPVDNTTYFYMEGMNAPMGAYPNRGHAGRAAGVLDRSIKETAPGVFSTRVRLPVAGKFDVAFMLDRPSVLHCFAAEVNADPFLEQKYAGARASFQAQPKAVTAGSRVPVRVRLTQGREDKPKTGLTDVVVRYFLAPSSPARQVAAKEVGDGVYEALVDIKEAGAYYLHVASPSLKLGFSDQPFTTLRAVAPPVGKSAGKPE